MYCVNDMLLGSSALDANERFYKMFALAPEELEFFNASQDLCGSLAAERSVDIFGMLWRRIQGIFLKRNASGVIVERR